MHFLFLLLSASMIVPGNTKPKYLAIGNSLTVHPKVESLWWNECGMAASRPSKDFAHLIASKLKADLTVTNCGTANGSWENSSSQERRRLADTLPECDYCTIQYGENIYDNEHLKTLKGDITYMIRHLKSLNPCVKIVLIGTFWLDTPVHKKTDRIKKAVASKEHIYFVPLKKKEHVKKGTKVYGSDGSVHNVANPAVIAHPGDREFRYIARCVLKKF